MFDQHTIIMRGPDQMNIAVCSKDMVCICNVSITHHFVALQMQPTIQEHANFKTLCQCLHPKFKQGSLINNDFLLYIGDKWKANCSERNINILFI